MLDCFVMQAIFAKRTASAGSECIAESFDNSNVAPQLKEFYTSCAWAGGTYNYLF
jgi:hypothetical protein